MNDIKKVIRSIPDFPKEGILFYDITPLLQDPGIFKQTIEFFRNRYKDSSISKIAAMESRGFFFAAPLCYALGCGLVPMRKPGKLPYETVDYSYSLEYGEATLEMHTDAIGKGERVLILDDLLATGGTARAAVELVRKVGGEVVEVAFLIELTGLEGRKQIQDVPVFSLIEFE